MGEELVAEAAAFGGALDQARNVGDHEFLAVHAHDAEVRHQRGEGIVRDLRPGVRGGREEGRFAGVGQAQQARVGDELQPQPDRAVDAGLARIRAGGRAVGRALEAEVAPAAIAALREEHPLAHLGQVGDHRLFVLVDDLGADRHLQHDVVAGPAGALAAHAGLPRLGEEMLLVAEVDQRVQPVHGLGPDRATIAAVAPVGAAELDELLAPEADAAAPAPARADVDFAEVEELHGRNFPIGRFWR